LKTNGKGLENSGGNISSNFSSTVPANPFGQAAEHWHNWMPSIEVLLNCIFGKLIMTTNEITYL